MGGEVIIINFDNGDYYSLDRCGCDIWRSIEDGKAVGRIISEVLDSYQGRSQDIQNEVIRFLGELERENLIVRDPLGTSAESEADARPAPRPTESGKPAFVAPFLQKYSDMQELLLLDPIHEVDERGWPARKPGSPERKDAD